MSDDSTLQKLISYPSATDPPTVRIQNYYDKDNCSTTEGEKIRIACIDTSEIRDKS